MWCGKELDDDKREFCNKYCRDRYRIKKYIAKNYDRYLLLWSKYRQRRMKKDEDFKLQYMRRINLFRILTGQDLYWNEWENRKYTEEELEIMRKLGIVIVRYDRNGEMVWMDRKFYEQMKLNELKRSRSRVRVTIEFEKAKTSENEEKGGQNVEIGSEGLGKREN